jgi:hypothetical protein
MIKINMDKAREIKKEHVRQERIEKLSALDVAFMRAVEVGDTELQQEIAAKKQALRDATDDPVIANASTPDELKEARPSALDIEV